MTGHVGRHRRLYVMAAVEGFLLDLQAETAENAGDPEPYQGRHRDNSDSALARDVLGDRS